MKTIRVGVIGWGFMGKTHTMALRNIALFYPDIDFEVKLQCICTRRIEKAQEAARLVGFECYTSDWRELIAMEDVDVVSICTPNQDHEEMAIAALNAGKHVYLDKPVAVTGASAMCMALAAKNAAGKTRVAFNNRYLPAMLRARQLINEGRIGRLLQFEARYLHSGSIEPGKPIGWKQQMQGGVLLDLGSHVLDLTTWLLGYPVRALCRTRVLYSERPTRDGGIERNLADDHALMLLEMENGALGTVEASKIATGSADSLTLEIRGDKGALHFDLMEPSFLDFFDLTQPASPIGGMRGYTRLETVGQYPAPGGTFLPPKSAVGWERGHLHCYYTFLNAVAHDLPVDCTIAEGARLQCLMDRLAESNATGQWVEIQNEV